MAKKPAKKPAKTPAKKAAPRKKSAKKPAKKPGKKPAKKPGKKAAPRPGKKAQLAAVDGHTHPFWRLLEAKKQLRKEHEEQQSQNPSREFHRDLQARQQMRFSKFAGPRRRAA